MLMYYEAGKRFLTQKTGFARLLGQGMTILYFCFPFCSTLLGRK